MNNQIREQVDEVMRILTTIRKRANSSTSSKAFGQAEFKTQMDRLIDDALWELGGKQYF